MKVLTIRQIEASEKDQSPAIRTHQLLNELLQLVKSKSDKATVIRQIVRQLRKSISAQQKELKSQCSKGKINEEIKAWNSGISGSCKHCGMNHFVLELRRIGQQTYVA